MVKRICSLPAQYAVDFAIDRNPVRQIKRPAVEAECESVPFTRGRFQGERLTTANGEVIVLPRRAARNLDSLPESALFTTDGIAPLPGNASLGFWSECAGFLGSPVPDRLSAIQAAVTRSWAAQFRFVEESIQGNGTKHEGLRKPQIGAIHAAIAHWKMADDPATIVMPTGTGKTETMVAISVHEMPTRVFVLVPSDVLRTQLADKFQTLGLLKQLGVCGTSSLYPIVGVLKHKPKTPADLKAFLDACNVVVSTMALVSRFSKEEQEWCASACTHLFVDEAHHIRAATWEVFRNAFKERRVLQFTATPFRNDGQHVDGRVIFNYPLRKAQEEGYFTPIRLRPVFEFDPEEEDRAIAGTAIKQLADDIAAGHDHLLLARTATISSAEVLLGIYEALGKDFHPQLIHSKLSPAVRRQRTKELRERHARIAICVDMFGEGFDLPELKIAALHDAHKSLAVTLQFTGRFARTKSTIGSATVVVNLADPNVDDSLRELYAEGSDWNQVLRTLSEEATGEHSDQQQFLDDFAAERAVIPTQNLTPKLSVIVYRTHCKNWKPHRLADTVTDDVLISGPSVNPKRHVAYIVTKERSSIDWGEIREFVNTAYELCVLHWDKDRNLLFIYSSNKEASHEKIAKIVAGDDVELIKGTTVFRVFSGLRRLLLQTVGLSHAVGRLIRFTMLVGADIHAGLAEGQAQTKGVLSASPRD